MALNQNNHAETFIKKITFCESLVQTNPSETQALIEFQPFLNFRTGMNVIMPKIKKRLKTLFIVKGLRCQNENKSANKNVDFIVKISNENLVSKGKTKNL